MKKNLCREDGLPRIIYQTSLNLQTHADQTLAPYDLTTEQFHILKTLWEESKSLSQREIADYTDKSPANLTKIIDRLESKELVIRNMNPDDRRSFLISITDKGERLLDEIKSVFDSFRDSILEDIDEKTQNEVILVLERINDNIKNLIISKFI